jgi:hypothetical protein
MLNITDLKKFIEALDSAEKVNGRNDKLALLKSVKSETAIYFSKVMMDPYITLGVHLSKVDNFPPIDYEPTNDHLELLVQTIENCIARQLTGNSARFQLLEAIKPFGNFYGKWLVRIINRDAPNGVGYSTIQQAFDNPLGSFSLQLAEPIKNIKSIDPSKYIVEEKIDGIRGIFFRQNNVWSALSRNGKPLYNLDFVLKDLEHIPQYLGDIVLDGELFYKDLNTSLSITKSSKTASNLSNKLVFYVFDFMTLPEWINQLKLYTLAERKAKLCEIINPRFKNVQLIKSIRPNSIEQIEDFYEMIIDNGGEGIVLKELSSYYNFVRDSTWLKLKPEETAEFEIVGATLCNPNKEYVKQLNSKGLNGSIALESIKVKGENGVISSVSKMSSLDRFKLGQLYQQSKLIGRTATIKFFSNNGSLDSDKLRFASFVALRDDLD